MDDHEDRVRERAYQLWQQEGCPPGRERDHWDKARELVAIEENYKTATIPVGQSALNLGPSGEPIEPILAAENVGELPTLTDQGEEQAVPKRRKPAAAAAFPAPESKKSPRSKPSQRK
jgi:hypothetical protein